MSGEPWLELVICTYNNGAMLERVLAAIAEQVADRVDWGVLVVNNNCTDDTAAIVNRAIEVGKIPDLRMVIEPTQGLTPARLCGVRKTTAPWIAFVDDDCLLQPDWVAQAAAFARAHPTCGAFGGRVTLEWESPPPTYVLNFKYSFAEQEHGSEARAVGCLVGAGMVLNREALIAVGWCDRQFLADRVGKKLVSGGDVEIALRLGSQYELWYTPTFQLFHQIPAQRTHYQYLKRINFGLGSSKLFGDSMLWSQSEHAWLVASLREAWRQTAYIVKVWLKAWLQQQSTLESAITLQFWCGYSVGIWRLWRLEASDRRQIVGCAQPVPKPLAFSMLPEGPMV